MLTRSLALVAGICLAFSSFTYGQGLSDQLFITEVMWDSSHPGSNDAGVGGNVNGDWFELLNASDAAIDMSGFQWDDNKQLSEADGVTVFPAGFVIQPSEVLLIVREDNDVIGGTDGFRASWGLSDELRIIGKDTFADSGPEQFSGLSGNGDEVNLYDASGVLINSIAFGEATTGLSNQWGFDNGALVDLGLAVTGESGAFTALSDGGDSASPTLDVASPGFVFGFGDSEVLGVVEVCALVAAGERTQDDLATVLAARGTLPGDADLNGTVEFADFLVLSQNFGQGSAPGLGDPAGWVEGDFDCNGTIEFADFLLISSNFGKSAAGAATSVPEPSTATLSFFALFGLMLLRRRSA